MRRDIAVGAVIPVQHRGQARDALVRKVGTPSRGDGSAYAWSMLTLDVDGECAYAVAREDELEGQAP